MSFISAHYERDDLVVFITLPKGTVAKYGDEYVCDSVCVCLSVCLSARISR